MFEASFSEASILCARRFDAPMLDASTVDAMMPDPSLLDTLPPELLCAINTTNGFVKRYP